MIERLQAFARTPLGSGAVGGLVVTMFGALALATGLIGDDGGTPSQPVLAQPASGSGEGLSVGQIYAKDAPGVVFVRAEQAQQESSPFDLIPRQGGTATGSGFVLDREGDVLTNAHVVEDAASIKVSLKGDPNDAVDAELVGLDASSDVALLKVDADPSDLHPLELGDSSKVQVGDPVVAIGNPFGLDRTVTSGIVSALQREISAPNNFTIKDVIQTDAPINPGNSGGPLIDSKGRVIGINSQIATGGGGGSVGVGFAVPIDTVREVSEQLMKGGEVSRAFLGITGATITPSLAKALDLPINRGVLVQEAFDGGPASRAGIRGGSTQVTIGDANLLLGGDIITGFGGKKVTRMEQIVDSVDERKPGDDVKVAVLRKRKKEILTVTLGQRPQQIQDSEQQLRSP
jgi:S1-C subfamily serine protease